MVHRADKLRLKKLLMEAISLLCKNGLPVQSSFRIDATIGITLSEDEVVLVSFREVVQPDGAMVPTVDSGDEASANGVSSDNEDLNCNLEGERVLEADADCVSSLPRTKNEGEEKTREQNSTWTENAAVAGDSFPRILRNRKLSSKERPSNDFRVSSDAPKTRSQIGHSFDDELIQIKDEVVDDEDCSFVKMEDGTDDCVRTFDSLGRDDSWIHQVYNEANVYDAGSNKFQQFAEGLGYSGDSGQTTLDDASSWNISSRGSVKPLHPKRSSRAGGGFSLPGVRQNPAYSSHSQDHNVARTLQSLCKTLADQACSSAPGGESVFCHICGARLSSHATLVKHIKGTHLAMSACQCDICGQSFKWTMQLCRHRKRYHSDVLVV